MKLALVVMAAGMGSRYGGLKQLDQFGPSGESIIHYSVYDAMRAGFTKVVFIIRRDFEKEFRDQIGSRFEGRIEVAYAFQSIDDLPDGRKVPEGRSKPWGTGQAILSAKDVVSEAFLAINGDDFYGADAYQQAAEFFRQGKDQFCMVGFQIGKTLSENGTVTRGLCQVVNGNLCGVRETTGLIRKGEFIVSDAGDQLKGHEPVSMNMWGFTPRLFAQLESRFSKFLAAEGNEMKSEFFIPKVVDNLIKEEGEKVAVLDTSSQWFGVTYQEDKPEVKARLDALHAAGQYPAKL
jgi:NDP-sugar pyrophosphorylase family protein